MYLLDVEELHVLSVEKLGPCGHIWWDVLLTRCGGRPRTVSKISHLTLDRKQSWFDGCET